MMMEDNNDSDTQPSDHIAVPPVRSSTSQRNSRGAYNRDRKACNLDLNNSPSLRPGSAARDSGYNTDVSPAATISPATNTSRQQHFVFDNISNSNIPELEDRISSLSNISPYLGSGGVAASPLTSSCHSPFQLHFEHRHRSTPPLRLSPDIFKVGASPCRASYSGTRTSSRPVSEASDTNRIQFDFDSDNEDDGTARRDFSAVSNRISSSVSKYSGDPYDVSESCLGLPIHILNHDDDDDDDEDDVFHNSDDVLRNWGVGSDPNTPINRRSLSLRQRRYCSAGDEVEEDESFLGACGGRDPKGSAHSFGANETVDRRRHSFNDSCRGRSPIGTSSVRKAVSGSEIKDNAYLYSNVTSTHSESSLSRCQDIETCNMDSRHYMESDSDNVFEPDNELDDDVEDNTMPHSLTKDKTHNSVVRSKLRLFSVTACLRLSSGCLLPWTSAINRVSVSTQTPHMASIMIQQLLGTPVSLPNEARGTAAAALRRRQSEGGQPQGPRHLPDIIPYVRDRAMSVPDAQTLAELQQAREVGRELRRLSDEMHFGVYTVNHLRAQAGGRRFFDPLNNFLTFIRQRFLSRGRQLPIRHRQGTSVDLIGNIASMPISEQSEDLPGD